MRSFQSLLLILLVATCQSFTQISVGRASITNGGLYPLNMASTSSARCIPRTVLFSSADEPEKEPSTTDSTPETATPAPATSVVPEPAKMEVEEASSDVPLDIPSPLLLASSIILAIISVGRSPKGGTDFLVALNLTVMPHCFFLLLQAPYLICSVAAQALDLLLPQPLLWLDFQCASFCFMQQSSRVKRKQRKTTKDSTVEGSKQSKQRSNCTYRSAKPSLQANILENKNKASDAAFSILINNQQQEGISYVIFVIILSFPLAFDLPA